MSSDFQSPAPGRSSRMEIPAELARVTAAVGNVGKPYLVGGCVRDWLLGLQPHDFDVEVFDTDYDRLRETLAAFGPTEVVGKSFGVVKVRLEGNEYDFSLPRREKKTAPGHRGFEVEADASLSFAAAAARRDFTINAIGYDPAAHEVIDPHGGRRDLEAGILRHVGPAFVEDPLRVLRAFQLAARFNLEMAPETDALCRAIRGSCPELPTARIWHEWKKWAHLSTVPSRGIEILEATGWIDHFPALAALKNCPQDPEWHPEGDVLTHTCLGLDALVKIDSWKASTRQVKTVLTFAVLTHDFGKATTTRYVERRGRKRWTSPGHDRESGRLAEAFLDEIGAPKVIAQYVRPLVENHMYHIQAAGPPKPNTIRRLAARLAPASIEDLAILMTADTRGRVPGDDRSHPVVEALLEGARRIQVEKKPPRPLILGRHLIERGLAPGPDFKPILDELFQAQLEGAFTTEEEAMEYLSAYLVRRTN